MIKVVLFGDDKTEIDEFYQMVKAIREVYKVSAAMLPGNTHRLTMKTRRKSGTPIN